MRLFVSVDLGLSAGQALRLQVGCYFLSVCLLLTFLPVVHGPGPAGWPVLQVTARLAPHPRDTLLPWWGGVSPSIHRHPGGAKVSRLAAVSMNRSCLLSSAFPHLLM